MEKSRKIAWWHVALAGIVGLSFFLYFWSLAKEGYSNTYYAAAVKSMLDNPAAFFFGSFDSSLYVTVDKPALGLWIQTLSASVFGVNSFGILLPSALAGAFSVMLMYGIVKEEWGPMAGVIAAGIVAITPIFVALSRTNNMDMMLLFLLLCGAKFMLKAAKKQSLPYYMLAMGFIGLGFNVKMLQAYLALPAFIFAYFLGKGKFRTKLLNTLAVVAVLIVVSFSWAVVVDTIPADERPYVGGSQTNSVVELAIGYNGITRLLGHDNRTQDGRQTTDDRPALADSDQAPTYTFRQNAVRNAGGGVGGDTENGERGILRLYSAQLSGLISWFLLPALVMLILSCGGFCYWLFRRNKPVWTDTQRNRHIQLLFWSAWLLPMIVFFSIAGFMHRYYVVMLAPAIAALTAALAVTAWKDKRRGWFVPAAVIAVLGVQCVIVARTSWTWLLIPMLAVGVAGAFLSLRKAKHLQTAGAVLIAIAVFIAPLAWSLTPAFGVLPSNIPDAGPDLMIEQNDSHTQSVPGGSGETAQALNTFVVENYNGEKWALAVSRASIAAPIILETGLPVMSVGGFSGSDMILTLPKLKQYVSSGDLRYFLIEDRTAKNPIIRWVLENGKAIRLPNGKLVYDLKEVK